MSKEYYTGLIYKALVNDISVADQAALDTWLKDPINEQYASEIRNSWTWAEGYGEVVDLDMDREFAAVQKKIDKSTGRQAPLMFVANRWMALAASFLVLLAITFYWKSDSTEPEWITYVGTSAHTSTVLLDGSEVWLKEGSSISVPRPFRKNQREVRMQGSALFQVTHDSSRPFKVSTKNEIVEVLGTKFHIHESSEHTSIQLLEGKVRVTQLDGTLLSELAPGQQLINKWKLGNFSLEDELHENEFAWQSKKLVFQGQELIDVIDELISHFEINLILENSNIGHCLLTATFENKEVDEVISTIATIFDLNIVRENQSYHLKGGECQ